MKHFGANFARLTTLLLALLLIVACGGAPNNNQTNDAGSAAATSAPADPTPTAAPTSAPSAPDAPTASAAVTDTKTMTGTGDSAAAPTNAVVFTIDQSQSEASFTIDEVLRGSPNTVVGVTHLVTGEIQVDLADPAQTKVGVITIDASDLTTDANMRNMTMRRFILQSNQEQYKYITFEPTAIEGLPATVQPGDKFSFRVTGNLKIRDIVQPVTFDVNLSADSATQISGLATTTVTRSEFELNIPSVPSVADVSDDVKLELKFVALAQ